jgi:hypothetical protein
LHRRRGGVDPERGDHELGRRWRGERLRGGWRRAARGEDHDGERTREPHGSAW